MRFFNRNIPDGERDDEVGPIQDTSPKVDLSRRTFLAAALAALALAACNDEPETGKPVQPEFESAESIAEKYDLDSLRKMLIIKYPELGNISHKSVKKEDGTMLEVEEINPKFRKLGMSEDYQDDILVQAYFLKVSYQNLLDDKVISPLDSVVAD